MSSHNIITEILQSLDDSFGFIDIAEREMKYISKYCTTEFFGNITQEQADEILRVCCIKITKYADQKYVKASLHMAKDIARGLSKVELKSIYRDTEKYPGHEGVWLSTNVDYDAVYPNLVVKILRVMGLEVDFTKFDEGDERIAIIEIVSLTNLAYQSKILKPLLSLNFAQKLSAESEQNLIKEIFEVAKKYSS